MHLFSEAKVNTTYKKRLPWYRNTKSVAFTYMEFISLITAECKKKSGQICNTVQNQPLSEYLYCQVQ